MIIDARGRTLRSPGIPDDHKAAGVDYQSDYQDLQVRTSPTQSWPRDPPPGISDIRFDYRASGRSPRSPGIVDDHRAAGVDYQSDYQDLQMRPSRTRGSPRDPPPGISDIRFDNRREWTVSALARYP